MRTLWSVIDENAMRSVVARKPDDMIIISGHRAPSTAQTWLVAQARGLLACTRVSDFEPLPGVHS